MSTTFEIRGRCECESKRRVVSILCDICSSFGWEYGSDYDGYWADTEEWIYVADGAPSDLDQTISILGDTDNISLLLSKEIEDERRSIRAGVSKKDGQTSFSIRFDDDVTSLNPLEKYIFLNIAISICNRLDILRLFYSSEDSIPSVDSTDTKADFKIADVSFIPEKYINSRRNIAKHLPADSELLRTNGGYILICCKEIFCFSKERLAVAKTLNLQSI